MKSDTKIAIIVGVLIFIISVLFNPIKPKSEICLNVTYSSALNKPHTYTWCSHNIKNLNDYNSYILNKNKQDMYNFYWKNKTGKKFNPEEYYQIRVFDSLSGIAVSESNRSSFESIYSFSKES